MSENLISVNNVSVNFDYQENFISKKQKIHAVNNINIKIKKGSFFGLVGESGSGKTTLGRAILGANKISSGNVIFHDDERDYDLTNINKQDLKVYRKKSQFERHIYIEKNQIVRETSNLSFSLPSSSTLREFQDFQKYS